VVCLGLRRRRRSLEVVSLDCRPGEGDSDMGDVQCRIERIDVGHCEEREARAC
jgi:hypothetical protein